jgi:hypothetical protein
LQSSEYESYFKDAFRLSTKKFLAKWAVKSSVNQILSGVHRQVGWDTKSHKQQCLQWNFSLTTGHVIAGDTLITLIEYYSFIEVHVSGFDCHLLVYELTSIQGEVFLYIWHPSGSIIQVGGTPSY